MPWADRSSIERVARGLVFLSGSAALLWLAVGAYGGWDKIWCFTWMDPHRSTAMMMLTGTLRLHNGLSLISNDEQVYNGAGYTNWGYGVPLLQLPFHELALHLRAFPAGFFPDRAIFFFYLSGLPPLLWVSLARAMGSDRPDARWPVVAAWSWAATWLALACALFPFMAYRFLVYEETLSYLVVCELYAVCAYLWVLRSEAVLATCALSLAVSLGLLVRATGAVYFAAWFGLLLLERRSRARIVAFAATATPFVIFWLYSNYVRDGSPLSFGYANSNPWIDSDLPIQRFGSQCVDTVGHAVDTAWALFSAFFFSLRYGTMPRMTPHLAACHFAFELREPASSSDETGPFFGVVVLGLLAWTLTHHLVRRDRRLATYVPHLAFALLFFAYVSRGTGFIWRYAADFWPLVVLIAVRYVRELEPAARRFVVHFPQAVLLAGVGVLVYTRHVLPERPSIRTLDVKGDAAAEMPRRFQLARHGIDPIFPSRVACGDAVAWPYDGGKGWARDCSVDTFTNVYLGVKAKAESRYELRLETDAMESRSLRVYVNGRTYTAQLEGHVYRVQVEIDYAALTTPTVMATVEWTRAPTPAGGRLLSIELA
jgi:hypothetical protein